MLCVGVVTLCVVALFHPLFFAIRGRRISTFASWHVLFGSRGYASEHPNSLFVFPRAQEHTLPICFVCTSPRPMLTSHDESTRQRRVHTLPNCPHTVHRWSQCPKGGQAPIVFRQFVKNRLPVGLPNPLESFLASFVRACSAAPGRRAFGKSSVKQIKNMEWMGSTGYQKQGTYVDICMGVQEQALAHGS